MAAMQGGGRGWDMLQMVRRGLVRAEEVVRNPKELLGLLTAAERRCGPSGDQARRGLVLLDRNGGFRSAVVRLPRGYDFVDRLAFDGTGHSLLFSTAPPQAGGSAGTAADDVTLWLWRDGEVRRLARQSRYRHPSWLP